MFTFAATPVKFVGLFVLYAWCTIWCVYELTRPQDVKQRVSNALHLAMAVVMVLMVAGPTWKGLTGIVPTPVLGGLFAAMTLWFVWRAVSEAPARGHFAGHAAMFAAMSWHLFAMAAMAAVRNAAASGHGTGMDPMSGPRQPGGLLWWFALVGIPFMAYLLFASVLAIRDALKAPSATAVHPVHHGEAVHACHEERPVGSTKYRLAALSDFAMNFGMFWMSTGIMVPILPFFAALAF